MSFLGNGLTGRHQILQKLPIHHTFRRAFYLYQKYILYIYCLVFFVNFMVFSCVYREDDFSETAEQLHSPKFEETPGDSTYIYKVLYAVFQILKF